MINFELEDFAHTQIQAALGSENSVTRVERLRVGQEQSALRLTLSRPLWRLVLKVAGHGTPAGVDFQRTTAALSLARAAGIPVPTVLATDTSVRERSVELPASGTCRRRCVAPPATAARSRPGPDCASGDRDGTAGAAVAPACVVR